MPAAQAGSIGRVSHAFVGTPPDTNGRRGGAAAAELAAATSPAMAQQNRIAAITYRHRKGSPAHTHSNVKVRVELDTLRADPHSRFSRAKPYVHVRLPMHNDPKL